MSQSWAERIFVWLGPLEPHRQQHSFRGLFVTWQPRAPRLTHATVVAPGP